MNWRYEISKGTEREEFEKIINDYYTDRKLTNIEYSSSDKDSLVYFMMKLLNILQQDIGTVCAIDYEAYTKYL